MLRFNKNNDDVEPVMIGREHRRAQYFGGNHSVGERALEEQASGFGSGNDFHEDQDDDDGDGDDGDDGDDDDNGDDDGDDDHDS